jgi:hypothetical protein
MVCGEELPAQWQELPLRTRQEIQAGRTSIGSAEVRRTTIIKWADEGEKFLNDKFAGRGLAFHTEWDTISGDIMLIVYRENKRADNIPLQTFLFAETCKAESFVTETMLTKILIVM